MTLCVCVNCLSVLLRGALPPWEHTCLEGDRPCHACEAGARARVGIEALELPMGREAWGPYREAREWEPCAVCGSELRGLRYLVTLRKEEAR
jgi:hypothetical protein